MHPPSCLQAVQEMQICGLSNHARVGLGYCLQATVILLVNTTNSLIDKVRHQCPVMMIGEWTFIYISPGKVT